MFFVAFKLAPLWKSSHDSCVSLNLTVPMPCQGATAFEFEFAFIQICRFKFTFDECKFWPALSHPCNVFSVAGNLMMILIQI